MISAAAPGSRPVAARPPESDRAGARWADALLAARLLLIDPVGLRGIAVRAGPGPVRDLWLETLRATLPAGAPVRSLPAGIEDDRLLGGIDLAATLQRGRTVIQEGVLAQANGGIVIVPMAERLAAAVAARIAGALDRGIVVVEREGVGRAVTTRIGVIALDEGATDDEQPPEALIDRLAFQIDLRDLSARGLTVTAWDGLAAARDRIATLAPASNEILEALVATAAAFGIDNVTAPLLALRAARAAAALDGRSVIGEGDAILAARLVLAPRARFAPAADEAPADEPAEPPSQPEQDAAAQATRDDHPEQPDQARLDEILLAAVQAALPDDLLEQLSGPSQRTAPSRRAGTGGALAAKRGRPAGSRMGSLRPGVRLALVDTLRAAAPWQPVRRGTASALGKEIRIEVRREDFRIKKFVERRERTIIFCVDASGSAAFHRLAEAKGAVELLLAEAYVARTHAALVVFRGTAAELLLPPTRSLSRAKSLLSTLPGGGGTPLAAGIDLAVTTALGERARGRDPLVVLLTDGRANIGRDGVAARQRAGDDATDAARQVNAHALAAIFIDTSPRPREDAAALATAMAARYVALPFVEATAVRDVVFSATPGFDRDRRSP